MEKKIPETNIEKLIAESKNIFPQYSKTLENVLKTNNMLERFRLLSKLRSSLAQKDEQIKEYQKGIMKYKRP